jgi:hypothetical protein
LAETISKVLAYFQKKLMVVTLELSPRYVPVLACVASTKHVPETFVGTLSVAPLSEQPEAVPLATLYVIALLPLPPDVANVIEVLIGAAVVVIISGEAAPMRDGPAIV